ncbi:MAG: DUF881 domain-containing protein, partial [Jatrophihabitantaceae bacterium]
REDGLRNGGAWGREKAPSFPRAPPGRRWYDGPTAALGCLLVGFVLVVAYLHANRDAPEVAKVHDSLVARVRDAQRQDAALSSTVASLDSQLSTLRDRALSDTGSLSATLGRLQLAAGELAVSGPGLEVTLSEPPPAAPSTAAPGRGGSTPIGSGNILTDRDVRSVVNELWADGAEAMSVNDIRLTPTSAVRFAGQAVLVDFQPITSPYTIRAVGNGDDLATGFASSAVASRYQTLAGADNIGFSFSEQTKLSLPASAPVTPRYARVPGGGGR